MNQTANRIKAAIQSMKGLEKMESTRFSIRHTNQDVHLAYLRMSREVETIARTHANEWIHRFLEGAKLIDPKWYPIKIDFVSILDTAEQDSRRISKEAIDAFSEEDEVEAKQMRWLGRSKPNASHASVVARLATQEQVERLLRKKSEGIEVTMFGCTVEVSVFFEENRPRACHQCQQFGHIKRVCKNPPECLKCGREGYEHCETETPKCASC